MRRSPAPSVSRADPPSIGGRLSRIDLSEFDALLFDLDGTLVDTMPLHYRAYAQVFQERGLALAERDYLGAVGAPARHAIPLMLRAAGATGHTEEDVAAIHRLKKGAFADILHTTRPTALPASRLIEPLAGSKKLAVVSSGNSDGVRAIIASMGWSEIFDVVISGDDVVKGKPDPEPYLLAAARLGVVPARCLVLEDAQAGLESGRAAGMSVLDVTRSGW